MIINTNIASLNTLRQLGSNEKSTRSSLEKLSSGFRINSAADDAAGLAISEKMRGQISGLNKASGNAQDGISMVSTAEGSLNETTSILQRMRELAVQGANDTNTTTDRTAIQTEMNQLTSEINRIGNTTEFNTQKLLKGKDLVVTTTAAAETTLAQGEAGVAQGVLSNYKLNASSVAGSASSTTVQASSKNTVGQISSVVAQTQASVKGVKSTVTLTNGISFQSDSAAANYDDANGLEVEIKQAATGGGAAATTISQAGGAGTKVTITIGTDTAGQSLATDRGTLFNQLDTAVKGFTFAAADKFSVVAPQSTASVVTDVRASGIFSGGKNETPGSYNFDITNPFGEAGDTITIAGKTFTGVTGTTGADPTKRQFQIDPAGSALKGTAAAVSFDYTTFVTDSSTKIVISVDNKDYTISSTNLDGNHTNIAGIKTMLNNAKAADGTLLSSVVTMAAGATLSIHSNSNGRVKLDIQSNVAADITKLQTALKMTDGQTDNMKDLQAASLLSAINADADISAHYTVTNTNNKLSFVENAGMATGVALQKPTLAGAGTNDFLTISNGNGQNLTTVSIVQSPAVTIAAAAAASSTLDTSFKLTASNTGTELNGLKVSFAGLTSGGTGVLASTWDAATDTLKVTGDLGALSSATSLSIAIQSAVSSGLSAAGFQTAGALGLTNATSTGAATLAVAFNGKTITFGDTDHGGTLGKIAVAADNDAVTVSADSKGDLTIYLAATTASNNTAAKIQQAIQDLQKTQTSAAGDFTKFTAKAGGNWDTATLGNFITTATSTMVGGKVDVKGSYSFDVSTAFKAGDIAEVAGQKFKAVASGADATKGEFNVSAGDMYAQAAGIADAISLNTALNKYAVTVDGFKINLTEKVAKGSDLKTTDLVVKAIGTAGQFSVDTGAINGNGGSFTIDGTVIKVSNKEANVGYANGTAIKVAATTADQTQALADAINKNATLSKKYTASVGTDGTLLLNQNEGEETATAPDVQVKTAPVGDFEAKLQIGANSGQTMTVTVSDMRSAALGISGDGSESTVAAKNGVVASYVATANVSNGTDNTNVEFALDISTADKATAAISVIDDATAAVSAARANLGAIQNRLEHTINNLGTSSQNITTAEANIRDVDMAKEMTNFQKNNILQQAAQAMLAQANQQPQGVLQLLR